MRRNRVAPAGDAFNVVWWQAIPRAPGTFGQKIGATAGFDPGRERYLNQSPVAAQSGTTFHIYKVDLDGASAGTAWTAATVRGIQMALAEATRRERLDVWRHDRPGLDSPDVARRVHHRAHVAEHGRPVTLTATNGSDTVQIFPDNGTNATTFPDNGSFTWDYGFLPPGYLDAHGRAGRRQPEITLTISAPPIIHLTEPDARGGRDFGRAVIGDAWDLTNPQDVTRFGLVGRPRQYR